MAALLAAGANPNPKNADHSPLIHAPKNGNATGLNLLLAHGGKLRRQDKINLKRGLESNHGLTLKACELLNWLASHCSRLKKHAAFRQGHRKAASLNPRTTLIHILISAHAKS